MTQQQRVMMMMMMMMMDLMMSCVMGVEIRAPRLGEGGVPLVPVASKGGGVSSWAAPHKARVSSSWLRRGVSFDPGAASEVGFFEEDAAPTACIYESGGARVLELPAGRPLLGSWRLLCTSGGSVVQSVARIVDAQIHCGCLVGYTRGLGAAAMACGSYSYASREREGLGRRRALSLGLGGGSVASWLAG